MVPRALICGISGQDGAYLARLLLERGYEVFGSSRAPGPQQGARLAALGVLERVRLLPLRLDDAAAVRDCLQQLRPDEIYNLAGQSSVAMSFREPLESWHSIVNGTLHLLDALRCLGKHSRLFNAASGECFGDTGELAADEATPFRPHSPYAAAKAAAFWAVSNYRMAYGLYACSGLLFNHESPFRGEGFVTRKIVAAACRIAAGRDERLQLGRLDIRRDWGWAPDYVEAMWRMLQQPSPEDYVIATGASHSIAEFVEAAFSAVGLDWRAHVDSVEALLRPSDPLVIRACPAKAATRLGWQAQHRVPEVAAMMVEACLHPPGST